MSTSSQPSLRLATPTGEWITVRTEVDWKFGLATYHVAEAGGWFTLTPARAEPETLNLDYGRPEEYSLTRNGTTWKERPRFNGLEVSGAASIDITTMERYLSEPGWEETDTWQYWLNRPRRATPRATGSDPHDRARVTDRAHQRAASTVAALVRHYVQQPERAELRQALEYACAPSDIERAQTQRRAIVREIRDRARTTRALTRRIAELRLLEPAPRQRHIPQQITDPTGRTDQP